MKKNILSLLSGGLDSFVLLDFLLLNKMNVFCLFVDYGQISANLEYEAFLKICKFKSINWHQKVEIRNFGENFDTGLTRLEIKDAFFPSRNLLLITIASAFVIKLECDYISIGVIKSSNEYPDCLRPYIDDLELIISKSIKKEIKILTPVDGFTKLDVIKYSMKYHLPIELSYSCEKGIKDHCKECPSCFERFEALNWFKLNS